MSKGIYPGSFDPITNGHLDIITRASKLVDELVVAVLINPNKPNGMLTIEERLELLGEATAHLKNVKIDSFSGLLVDYAKMQEARVVIRGLRSVTDFENEMNMAQMNRSLLVDLETIFLVASPEYGHVSSSAIRQLAYFGGEYELFLPSIVANRLKNK